MGGEFGRVAAQHVVQFVKIALQGGAVFGRFVPFDQRVGQQLRFGAALQQFGHGLAPQQDVGQADVRHFDFPLHIGVGQRGDFVADNHRAFAQGDFEGGGAAGYQYGVGGGAGQVGMGGHQLYGQVFEPLFGQQGGQAVACGMGGNGQQEAGGGVALQDEFGRLKKYRRHVVDFADAAAGQQGEYGGVAVEFHSLPGGGAVGFQRHGLRHRVADEFRPSARITVELRFHREEAEDAVGLADDFIDASAPPCPNGGADVVDGGDARLFEFFFDVEVEVGRVDADKHVRLRGAHFFNQAFADGEDFGQAFDDFGKPAHGEFFLFVEAFETERGHARAADAGETGVRTAGADGFHQVRAEQVARGFARAQGDEGGGFVHVFGGCIFV